ncbi:MAG: hypothetical protein ACKO1K_00365 [Burkholderiales bacterium]
MSMLVKQRVVCPVRIALPLLALPMLTACASYGIPVIDIDIAVSISGGDASGATWQSSQEQFSRAPLHKFAIENFPAITYDGERFFWRFFVQQDSIGTGIRSKGAQPVCFRFDQATLRSNMNENAVPLRIKWHRLARKPVFSEAPTYGQAYTMPEQCFDETYTRFDFGPELDALFPNGSMFNVKLSESGHSMTSNGRGNWLKLRVPIEIGAAREDVEITLTAINSDVCKIQF